ncbi:MAG: hypothetical protein B6229_01985 [Spirochaetaceae bacterium 4572_7]|nr:MAG: hypothetical protein B6229_01985 [Spirochaetaceae bacterium 4572_7]
MHKQFLVIFLIISFRLISQEISPLPQGFRDITIGLSLEDAKVAIESDGYFDYQGDPDVSMLLSENRSIIETKGNFYIDSGVFQFYNDSLFTITLILDTRSIDYYTIFTTLKNKYGIYKSLTPKKVIWESSDVRIILEKPLTIKYVGLAVYNQIIEADTTEKAVREQLKEDFINEL